MNNIPADILKRTQLAQVLLARGMEESDFDLKPQPGRLLTGESLAAGLPLGDKYPPGLAPAPQPPTEPPTAMPAPTSVPTAQPAVAESTSSPVVPIVVGGAIVMLTAVVGFFSYRRHRK